jgi:DNA-binding MarR family transcriptional regulator
MRSPDREDRRVWLVTATEAGRSVAGEVAGIDTMLRSRLRRGISKAERQQLASLLLRLQSNLAD